MLFFSSCALSPEDMEKAVHEAAENGDLERLRGLIETAPELVHHQNAASASRSRTPLHEAGTRAVAEFLVANGADVMAEDHFNWTPLHTAKSADVAEYLISQGADVNAQAQRQFTPLHVLEDGGAAEVVIKKGGKVNMPAKGNVTPIPWQIQSSQSEVVPVLLKYGARTTVVRKDKKTLLHMAADRGSPENISALLKKGLRVNALDSLQATPLHYAVYKDRVGNAEVLLEHRADPNRRLSEEAAIISFGGTGSVSETAVGGYSPLQLAQSEEMKTLLREHGAKD
jgi:ankyrin repeat protein